MNGPAGGGAGRIENDRSEPIQLFSGSPQLRMKFIQLINVKMPIY